MNVIDEQLRDVRRSIELLEVRFARYHESEAGRRAWRLSSEINEHTRATAYFKTTAPSVIQVEFEGHRYQLREVEQPA